MSFCRSEMKKFGVESGDILVPKMAPAMIVGSRGVCVWMEKRSFIEAISQYIRPAVTPFAQQSPKVLDIHYISRKPEPYANDCDRVRTVRGHDRPNAGRERATT